MKSLLTLLVILLTATLLFSAEITYQPGSAGIDSQISSATPSNNWGTRTWLTDNWGTADTRGVVKFDLTAAGFDSTHKYKVDTATISIYHEYNSPVGKTWYLYRILATWDEMTITYSNRPDYDTTAFSSVVCVQSEGFENFNSKTMVQQWLDATYPNYGFYLYMGSSQSGVTYWRSSDNATASSWPKLYVKYTDVTSIIPTSLGDIKALYR